MCIEYLNPSVTPIQPIIIPDQPVESLPSPLTNEEIEEFRLLLEKARKYDQENNQKDCELEENKKMSNLTFDKLSEKNKLRCEEVWHPLNHWNSLEWAGALCGEAGELANKCKKIRRGQNISDEDVDEEIADIVIYADLLASSRGKNLGDLVQKKFNKVSQKKISMYYL